MEVAASSRSAWQFTKVIERLSLGVRLRQYYL